MGLCHGYFLKFSPMASQSPDLQEVIGETNNLHYKVNFIPAKICFSKIQKKNLAEKKITLLVNEVLG
jgi:hypothetical protein